MSVSPVSGTTGPSNGPNAMQKAAKDPLADKSTFLKLLVSQIRNQDPLNPTDSVQFLSQLTSFSQLEQLISINQELAPPAPKTP